ncbi:hypothetical protein F4V47_01495 [Lactococcus garvieae subsp. garvieae]|uniref:phage tail tube assembly chaperone n=1 Tax=Lactococcus garvieae TaxID=1363 RepID=UPI0005A94446|nr:phage tail tube assembly chaperone [Lactococcus garvieae]KAA8718821.1 hypothetical protein F4V47_01495 [Lactococcus garvieae subsp. garvieae]MDG6191138.1 phage tail assembly chaperone [Lactococcus garvieae]PCS00291.1 hypothetical protein RU85_GL000711 [Lactococcus garvieae]QPR48976.1 hypothetical protein I6G86_00310 [Lactococcus garvieae]
MIKINTKPLGLSKSINLKATVGLKQEANRLMIQLIQLSSPSQNVSDEIEDPIEQIQKADEVIEGILQFIQKALRLTDKQIDDIKYSIDEEELGQFMAYLVQRFNGYSDEQIRLSLSVEQQGSIIDDPKKELPDKGQN